MSIKIFVMPNPFSSERNEYDIETPLNLREIFDKFNVNTEETALIVYVNDEYITDELFTPKEGDIVYIKVVPLGEAASRVGGALLIVAGLVVSATGVGGPIGGYLIASGAAVFFSPEIGKFVADAFAPDIEDNYLSPKLKEASYLRGGKNKLGQDEPVPVILGKNRYYPFQMAWPYLNFDVNNSPTLTDSTTAIATIDARLVELNASLVSLQSRYNNTEPRYRGTIQRQIDRTEDQITALEEEKVFLLNYENRLLIIANKGVKRVVQGLLWGHKDLDVDIDSYRLGDALLSTLDDVEIAPDSTSVYGTKSKKQVNVNKRLKAYQASGENAGFTQIEVLLPTNITKITLQLTFGLFYARNSDGGILAPETIIEMNLLDITTNPTGVLEYSTPMIIRGGESTLQEEQVDQTLVDYEIPFALDPNKLYKLQVTRLKDDKKDKASILFNPQVDTESIDCVFTSVLCEGNSNTITTNADNLYRYATLTYSSTDFASDSETLNAIVQTNVLDYDGVGTGPTAWSKRPTSNPASMYLYVLQGQPNKRPVPDSEIDWESLEEWHEFCETNGFECNAVLDNPGTISSILTMIAMTGRAAPIFNGKYKVIIDQERIIPKQMFTNKNTLGFTLERDLESDIHGIYVTFNNAEKLYQPDGITVFAEGYDANTATKLVQQEIVGVTDYVQIQKLMDYRLKCAARRVETIIINVDIEHILCTLGDLVTVSYDEILLGLNRGRITAVVKPSTLVTALELDEEVTFEVGKDYAITVRLSDNTQTTIAVNNTEDTTRTVTFTTPVALDILAGDLYSFGISDKVTGEYIVSNVIYGGDFSGTLTLTNYAPEVYQLGTLPPFVSNVSIPSNFGATPTLEEVYRPDEATIKSSQETNKINRWVSPSIKNAVLAQDPDAQFMTSNALEIKVTNDYIYYVSSDNLHIYYMNPVTLSDLTEEVDEPIKEFDVLQNDLKIVYSAMNTGNTLKTRAVGSGVSEDINTAQSAKPQFINDNEIAYINYDDGDKVYITDVFSTDNGTVLVDYPAHTYSIHNESILWTSMEDGVVYKKLLTDDPTYKGEIFLDDIVVDIIFAPESASDNVTSTDTFIYIDPDSDISYKNGFPYFGTVSRHAISDNSSYAMIQADSTIWHVNYSDAGQEARLNVETNVETGDATGDLTYLSNRIENISVEDIDLFVRRDKLYATGIQPDTEVTFVGSNYITMSKYATSTVVGASIDVVGTRLLLNANKVIIPGTVEAGLLATDAINSKDRVQSGPNAGEHIYEHDLITGEEKHRNSNGDIIREFTASGGLILSDGVFINQTGGSGESFGLDGAGKLTASEVDISGNINATSGTFSGSLVAADGTFNGDLIINSDDENRKVEVGSKGLKVTDSGARIVHDLPSVGQTGYSYLGHPYLIDNYQNVLVATCVYVAGGYLEDTSIDLPDRRFIGHIELNGFIEIDTNSSSDRLFINFLDASNNSVYYTEFASAEPRVPGAQETFGVVEHVHAYTDLTTSTKIRIGATGGIVVSGGITVRLRDAMAFF